MKYKQMTYIALLVVITLLYVWMEARRPQPITWDETYFPEDKIPYGTYIVNKSLPQLFPDSKIVTSRLKIGEQLERQSEVENGAYIFVGRSFMPEPEEWLELKAWVLQGNILFVAATCITDTLLKDFGLEQKRLDTLVGSRLLYAGFEQKDYRLQGNFATYFVMDSVSKGEVLGCREWKKYPDFIQLECGIGQVFLNANPRGYTNFEVLDSICGDYYCKTLSCIPADRKIVIWEAWHTLSGENANTPFRVILRHPALRLALYLLLAGGLLYLFFRARREQRPIPLIQPPENRMLEFIATVSALYYKKKEHALIATKRIDFFLDKIRSQYLLYMDIEDEQFAGLLAERAGMEKAKTIALIQLIIRIRKEQQVSSQELEKLMEDTESFIRKMEK